MEKTTRLTDGRPTGSEAYFYKDGLYLNVTNRCPTTCAFCVKREWKWRYRGWDLRLRREPSVAQLCRSAEQMTMGVAVREIVFCGYGEPTYRLDAIAAVGQVIAQIQPGVSRRLNTVGLGSAIWSCDIVPLLKRHLDVVSISLNAACAEHWRLVHRPRPRYHQDGFNAVLDFIARCSKSRLRTIVTAVEKVTDDMEATERLARSLGAEFRPRPYLPEES
ncbi:MAG: TatD family nuclease-associated radical SAM protein [Elusimicrobiota bacterium]